MTKLVPIHKPHIDFQAPAGLTHGFMGDPVRVILHDTEGHDTKGITDIQGVFAFWMRGPDKLGSQFIVDAEGNIGQGGEPTELMFHTLDANTGSVGIEQIGFASFTKQTWEARPDQLIKVAKLLAWLNAEYHIPLRISTVHGISTHAMQTIAHHVVGGHTDPGKGYPLDEVIAIAKGFKDAGGWPPDNKPSGGANPGHPKPKPKPTPQRIYSIAYTNKHGDPAQTASFNPGLWVVTHPRTKRRGSITINPAGKQKK